MFYGQCSSSKVIRSIPSPNGKFNSPFMYLKSDLCPCNMTTCPIWNMTTFARSYCVLIPTNMYLSKRLRLPLLLLPNFHSFPSCYLLGSAGIEVCFMDTTIYTYRMEMTVSFENSSKEIKKIMIERLDKLCKQKGPKKYKNYRLQGESVYRAPMLNYRSPWHIIIELLYFQGFFSQ